MTQRFAERTSVPAAQTQGEIKKRLKDAGANQIAVFESDERTAIAFHLGFAMYRVTIPIIAEANDRAQEERRAWRLMGLLIKSKLEAIREGATTVEREFLSDMVLYDGQTVSERMGPELQIAHEQGRMPKTLMLGAPR